MFWEGSARYFPPGYMAPQAWRTRVVQSTCDIFILSLLQRVMQVLAMLLNGMGVQSGWSKDLLILVHN